MSETGEQIKKIRKQRGLSADQLAEKIGVSRSTMFRYENGDVDKASGKILMNIANALQIEPSVLMGWTDEPDNIMPFMKPNVQEREFITTITKNAEKLNADGKKMLYDYSNVLIGVNSSDRCTLIDGYCPIAELCRHQYTLATAILPDGRAEVASFSSNVSNANLIFSASSSVNPVLSASCGKIEP